MIKFENTQVMNMDNAIRGMRNPLNSHDNSDSYWTHIEDPKTLETAKYEFFVGYHDLDLMKRLCQAGSDHRKFLRQIFVSVDITAPLYWWKEADTYKVGTVANSESTMHTIHKKEFELSDFSFDDINFVVEEVEVELNGAPMAPIVTDLTEYYEDIVDKCEALRKKYLETNDKKYWRALIQILPSSYNQMRTVTLNYEVLFNMYHSRKHHKLDEWSEGFTAWCRELPYFMELFNAAYPEYGVTEHSVQVEE